VAPDGLSVRIFYAADHSPNSEIPGSRLWYANLFLPLRDLGHELIPFEFDMAGFSSNLDATHEPQRSYIETHRPALEQALLAQVRKAHAEAPLDLFFSYFYAAHCRPEVIREIRALGVATMNWYCNASYQFHLVRDLAPAHDWCLVPERDRLDDYRAAGARPIYVQEAANPTVYHPVDAPRRYDLTFCGSCYGDRPDLATAVADADLDLRIFGPGWEAWAARTRVDEARLASRAKRLFRAPPRRPAVGPALSDDEMIRLYSESQVSLGFSSCGETHRTKQRILQVRLRDFEAPMCGAFYLVEYMRELADFFEEDKEMVFYRDRRELVDKARFYLANDDARTRIAQAGRRRALAEHTWQHRFRAAFREAGLG
jgi:spore maturation protein CgeB